MTKCKHFPTGLVANKHFSIVKTRRRQSFKDIDRYYFVYKYISENIYQYFNHKSHIAISPYFITYIKVLYITDII